MSCVSWKQGEPGAREKVIAEIEAEARRAAFRTVKCRSREYIAYPWQLNLLLHGYAAEFFTPWQLIEFGKEVLHQAPALTGRLDIVSVQKINAKAAILAGRYRRRFGS